jgi:hypothetical protein
MSKSLVRNPMTDVARVRENALANALADVAEEDLAVAKISHRAHEIDDLETVRKMLALDDEQLSVLGWTRKELRIALDAKLPKKLAPFYLHAAHERSLMRWRNGTGEAASVTALIVLPMPSVPPEERENVIDVTAEGDEKHD